MDLNDAKSLATTLMEHHLGVSSGWRFDFDRAVSTFGMCWSAEKKITLSRTLTALNDEKQVTDTILHEIAHAVAGHRAGHGPEWKAAARALGASPLRTSGGVVPPSKFIGLCPYGHEVYRNRRSEGHACSKCCRTLNNGRYSATLKLVWTRNPEYVAALLKAC